MQIIIWVFVVFEIAHCYRLEDLLFANSELVNFHKGQGKEFDAAQHSEHGEKGQSGYLGQHHFEQGQKGHHDKEGLQKKFAESGGNKQAFAHNNGYYGNQHKGEKGQKGYHFQDKGSYAKGHSTKGHHNVHKLDEYKKNTDFYDEDHDEAFKERHGGFEAKKAAIAGKSNLGGHFNKVYLQGVFGSAGLSDKGSHHSEDSGFNKALGQDSFYKNAEQFAKLGGNNHHNKFGFVVHH